MDKYNDSRIRSSSNTGTKKRWHTTKQTQFDFRIIREAFHFDWDHSKNQRARTKTQEGEPLGLTLMPAALVIGRVDSEVVCGKVHWQPEQLLSEIKQQRHWLVESPGARSREGQSGRLVNTKTRQQNHKKHEINNSIGLTRLTITDVNGHICCSNDMSQCVSFGAPPSLVCA